MPPAASLDLKYFELSLALVLCLKLMEFWSLAKFIEELKELSLKSSWL